MQGKQNAKSASSQKEKDTGKNAKPAQGKKNSAQYPRTLNTLYGYEPLLYLTTVMTHMEHNILEQNSNILLLSVLKTSTDYH